MSTTIPRIRPYPVMTDSSLDYVEGNFYETLQAEDRMEKRGSKFRIDIEHRLHGQNLVTEFLRKDNAVFACTVTAPVSAWRKVAVSKISHQDVENGLLVHRQVIDNQDVSADQISGEITFQPMVLSSKGMQITIAREHGLDEIWLGDSIQIPQAGILAMGPYWNPKNQMQSVLRLKLDRNNKLPNGCFEVKEALEEGFYFEVLVARDLYESLKSPGNAIQHRDSIYSAALAQGFQILKEKYQEYEDWNDFSNLRSLYAKLKSSGVPTWDKSEFSANSAVAHFHPHKLNTGIENDES